MTHQFDLGRIPYMERSTDDDRIEEDLKAGIRAPRCDLGLVADLGKEKGHESRPRVKRALFRLIREPNPRIFAFPQGGSMRAVTGAERRKLFEEHPLFGILSTEEIDALLLHARSEHYPAGRLIFARGSPGRSMMAVLAGSVRIGATSPNGREVLFALLNVGEIFGEMALLDGGERTADAIALSDCDLLVIDQRDFIPFLESRSDLCIRLLRLLSQRLRRTDELVETALFEPLKGRLSKALVQLASATSTERGAETPFQLHVSQKELSDIVGASRENVNKQLRTWQRAGLLELGKRHIVIRDLAALERFGWAEGAL